MSSFVHESSVIDQNVKIGEGTRIWHFCHISNNAHIGSNSILGQNVFVGQNVRIGNYVKIQNNVSVYEGVVLEDYVFCGPSCVFTNDLNPRSKYSKNKQYIETLVRFGATIGANATIVCGNSIGRHSLIGAGAVVIKSVKDYSIVVGNPARHVGWVCECGVKLSSSLICEQCKRGYELKEDFLYEK